MEIPDRWGFCMAGNEKPFCDSLDAAALASMKSKDEPFIYYEIGIGNGDTMEAVHSWLNQRKLEHLIIGVDLPNYSGSCSQKGWTQGPIALSLIGSEVFLSNVDHLANFIFIDACHGSPCVTRDFLLAEKKIKPGGVICFHDTDPNCQGQHFQEHCQMGIDARKAVEDLGLLNDSRPGWKKLVETWGDKTKSGHGALFVQNNLSGR